MGSGCRKAAAGQVQPAAKKEPLPAALAAASQGRFQSALSPISEGRRDFARIFFADERKIFVIAQGMPSMRPLQPTSNGMSKASVGDMSEQVVSRAEGLFRESLSLHLDQALSARPDPDLLEKLLARAIAAMTVNVGVDFALQMRLLPTFLQPVFLIIVLGDLAEARAATYGFVAERPQQIVGDRPESKRTPFCVRLLSPNLLDEAALEDGNKWEVEYSAMEVRTSTCTQAVEMDMPKVREAINSQTWDPLLCEGPPGS